MTTDEKYMARCLQLARLGNSYTAPNPMVGAVIVYADKIIGEGFHRHYGEAHAEPNAIFSVKEKELLPESTLYVSLEPCSHFGKTPPCANLIVSEQIKRVVIGTLDPNPKVSGRGADILRNSGIEVTVGVLEKECRELNKRFFCFQNNKRPFITLKWAQTRDGFIDKVRENSNTPPLKISNPVTIQLTHKMRAENMAIMVSTNTAVLDNPSLTLRHWFGKSPVRVIIDRKGIIPEHFLVKDLQTPTLIFTERENLSKPNLEYITLDSEQPNLPFILQTLFEHNILSVLVEGGAKLLGSFIQANLWDEANVEISPSICGNGVAAPTLTNAVEETREIIEGHHWIHYHNANIQ